MPYPNIRSHQCIFGGFLSVIDSMEFCFSKNILMRHIEIFCQKLENWIGVGVISCDFWVCFLKSALYKAVHTTCMCFDVAKTDVKKGVNFVSDLDVKGLI